MLWGAAYLSIGWVTAEICNLNEQEAGGLKRSSWLWLVLGWPVIVGFLIANLLRRK